MFQRLFQTRQHRHDIFVPASVVAYGAQNYALMGSVVDWVNAARDKGAYYVDEIAEEAPQAYNADYYYAQVCNGGHGQFRHNSRMDPMSLTHALNGLKSAGLTELAACLDALMNAPDMDDPAVQALDDRFFAAYSDYHARINAWLRPLVEVVPDQDYPTRMEAFLKLDDVRAQRFRDRETIRLQGMIENEQLAGYAHCVFGMTGRPFLGVRPGRFASFLGAQTVLWGIATIDEAGKDTLMTGFEVADRIVVVPAMPEEPVQTEDETVALLQTGHHVKKETILEQCAHARKERLGMISAILLEEVPDVSSEDVTALNLIPRETTSGDDFDVLIHVRGDRRIVALRVDDTKAILIDTAGKGPLTWMAKRDLQKALKEFDARNRVQ